MKFILIFIFCMNIFLPTVFSKDFGGVRVENQPCIAGIVLNEKFSARKIRQLFGEGKVYKTETTSRGNEKIWWSYKGATVVTVKNRIKLVAVMRKYSENHILLQTKEGIGIGEKSDKVLKCYGLPTYIQLKNQSGLDTTSYMYNQIGKLSFFSILDATNNVINIGFMSSDWYSL